ncbi:MAG: HEAT repeat domain-containing protein [Anaerolineales bacterium]|nr:HEAT repeat domain-containing protein [Anaerolineales bacterium]
MDWLSGSKQNEVKKLLLQLADVGKRDHAAQELIRLGADAVPALIESLQTQDLSMLLVYQHLLALIPSASPALTKLLNTAHPLLRGRVAEVFFINKDKTAISALLEALKGEYYTVRSRAALALGQIGDARVIPALFPLLKDKDEEVRVAACVAIGKFRPPSTFDEITEVLLDDPQIKVRQAAARALGDTRHPSAIPFLMEALRDSYWWYEKDQEVLVLLEAIEKMGAPVVDVLIEALEDHERNVRKFAVKILGNLQDVRAIEALGMVVYDLHHEVSQTAAEALAKFGAPAVGMLSEALSHPEAAVREHAVMGLGKIEDENVAPLLVEMLGDPERTVRKQALLSLGALKDARAVPALREIASSRTDREMAALAKHILERMK